MTLRYPVHLRSEGRPAVVVGAGQVAMRKIRLLLDGGARVTVVAPDACPPVAAWAAAGRLRWRAEPFVPAHLDGAFLAIAATSSRRVNAEVARAARQRHVLVNVADDPEASDFHVPAVLRRGDLVVSVSTGGRCPGFARAIKRRIDAMLGPEARVALEVVAAVRRRIVQRRGAPQPRSSYAWLINDELFRACRDGDRASLDAMLRDVLGEGYSLEELGVAELLEPRSRQ